MEKKSDQIDGQRRFMVVLPLLLWPFILLGFWALGGGKGNGKAAKSAAGLNLELPGANLKKDANDKMGFYEREKADSLKLKYQFETDSYFADQPFLPGSDKEAAMDPMPPPDYRHAADRAQGLGTSETRIYNQLRKLDEIVRDTGESLAYKLPEQADHGAAASEPVPATEGVDRLEKMIRSMDHKEAEDPDMIQMNTLLDKILAIQHPDKIPSSPARKANLVRSAKFDQGFRGTDTAGTAEEIGEAYRPGTTRFYSLKANDILRSDWANAIEAIVYESRTVVSGALLKLRLAGDISIGRVIIPKGNFLYGTVYLSGERLNITVKSIRFGNSILSVDLAAYDMDGLQGIYVPGSITRGLTGQAVSNAVETAGMDRTDPTLGGRAVLAGINAGKSLVSKRSRLVRVKVKAGYRLLLRNNNGHSIQMN